MGKKKSVVLSIIVTIVLAALCVMCFASFEISGSVKDFKSVVSVIPKDSNFGNGYATVIYPEGIISPEDYDNLLEEDKDGYYSYKGVYISEDIIVDAENGGYAISEGAFVKSATGGKALSKTFLDGFESSIDIIKNRLNKKDYSYLYVGVQDDYAIKVEANGDITDFDGVIERLLYRGKVTFNHSSRTSAIMKVDKANLKSVEARQSGTNYVIGLKFTDEGRAKFKEVTTAISANEEDNYLTINARGNELAKVTIEEAFDSSALYMPGFTSMEAAEDAAILMNSTMNDEFLDFSFSASSSISYDTKLGDKTATFALIALCSLVLAICIYSVIRFKGIGIVNLYAVLTYVVIMVFCLAFLCSTQFSYGVIFALLIGLSMLTACNCALFKNIEKELSTGKIFASSVKASFRARLESNLDLHIIFAILAIVLFIFATAIVPVTLLASFANILICSVVVTFLIVMFVTRFYICLESSLFKDKSKLCRFKKEVA